VDHLGIDIEDVAIDQLEGIVKLCADQVLVLGPVSADDDGVAVLNDLTLDYEVTLQSRTEGSLSLC
jgi:hypothetical protein